MRYVLIVVAALTLGACKDDKPPSGDPPPCPEGVECPPVGGNQ